MICTSAFSVFQLAISRPSPRHVQLLENKTTLMGGGLLHPVRAGNFSRHGGSVDRASRHTAARTGGVPSKSELLKQSHEFPQACRDENEGETTSMALRSSLF